MTLIFTVEWGSWITDYPTQHRGQLTLFHRWQTRPSWRRQLWEAQAGAMSPWSEQTGATVWRQKRTDCHHRNLHLSAAENAQVHSRSCAFLSRARRTQFSNALAVIGMSWCSLLDMRHANMRSICSYNSRSIFITCACNDWFYTQHTKEHVLTWCGGSSSVGEAYIWSFRSRPKSASRHQPYVSSTTTGIWS